MKTNFGAMVCLASNGVLRVDRAKDLIDKLAMMGYTFLELCIDDLLRIEEEPYYGYLRGGYSKEELQEIDSYGIVKGVEIIPCIQVLGHMENVLSNPHYFDIRDTVDIVLVDDPKTERLIDNIFKTLSECFSSRKVNIGFDEAHMVGLGRYLDKNGYVPRHELLLRHLNKVLELAEKYGFHSHMWADMFYKLANHGEYYSNGIIIPQEVLEKVPNNVGLCYWDYYSETDELYDGMMTTLDSFGRERWFAGGAYTWGCFAPLNHYSLLTMKPAMRQARKHGIENIIITMWGDQGNECSFFSVLPSLYAIRQYYLGNFDEDKIKAGFEELFKVRFDDFMLLDLPNKNPKNEHFEHPDCIARHLFYGDCLLCKRDGVIEPIEQIPYGEYRDTLRETGKRMGEYAHLYTNLANLCDVLELKACLSIRTRRAYAKQDKQALAEILPDYFETVRRIKVFRDSFRGVWMKDFKPYNWRVHEERIGGLMAKILDSAERIQEYLDGRVQNIPELEETMLPYGNWISFW